MLALDVPMQVWPSETCDIAVFVGAVVSKQQYGVLKDFILLIMDPQVVIGSREIFFLEFLKSTFRIIGEDHKG
jgi:hypothetical protein